MTIDPFTIVGLQHSAEAGGGTILDVETLQSLVELGGEDDPDLLAELLGLFLEDSTRRVQSLVQALEQGDIRAAGRAAHALKSASASLGALRFSDACREIECVARLGDDITPISRRVLLMFPEVQAAMTSLDAA